MIDVEQQNGFVMVRLNDPAKRNALSLPMFDALDASLVEIARDEHIHVGLLMGSGGAFCAGFDLGAAVDDPQLIATYIHRLRALNRQLRRMPQIVIAAVHGAAIAGGCAILSACDFVIVSPDAKLGYPVHQLGISPAVTIPTLSHAIGPAAARSLLMSGELIDGRQAHAMKLATHLASSCGSIVDEATALACAIASKPPNALRTTKRWLNELDGSLDDAAFDAPAAGSAALGAGEEARAMLAEHWRARKAASADRTGR